MSKVDWSNGAKGFVVVARKCLEYACFGPDPSQAPTIVMLHEGLGCVAHWRDAPLQISKATGCGVFAYSREGYGNSDDALLPRPLDYMTQEATAVLPAVLKAIDPQSCILLGHSDGATIAAIYAGSVIDPRVRGLILIAPHFFTEPSGLAQIVLAKQAFETGDLRVALAKYHQNPDKCFKGWNDAWLDPKFVDWDVSEVIDYLRIPTLAIQGVADEYGTLAQINELENRSYAPVDVVVLPECGHSLLRDAPEETLAAIVRFSGRLWEMEARHGAPA